MKAKEYMRQVQKFDSMIANKTYDMQKLHEIEQKQRAIGNDAKEIEEMQRTLKREIAELTAKRRRIIATIEELPPIEYDFLFRMYAKGESLYTISEAYNYSYQWALSTHAKAIKKLQKRLDASVNN